MQNNKPQLVQLLEKLSIHDRQSALDLLLKYPEMAGMIAKFFVMKKLGAEPKIIQKFENECLEKINKLYAE